MAGLTTVAMRARRSMSIECKEREKIERMLKFMPIYLNRIFYIILVSLCVFDGARSTFTFLIFINLQLPITNNSKVVERIHYSK